jgi:phosphonate transport system substrate-binding protein
MLRAVLVFLLLAGALNSAQAEKSTIRFGLTAVVAWEDVRRVREWGDYLSARSGHPVRFVQRPTYWEIMKLLQTGDLDFAWICGGPLVQKREPEFLKLLVVPVYRGEPLYHSFIIVHRDSPYRDVDDLEGRVFAYSDPMSNSGYLYPQALLIDRGISPDSYFRQSFFTFNHAETIEAVADRVADGGAVDSYVWDYMWRSRPEIVGRTRVIQRSQPFGFPPIVVRLGVDEAVVKRMTAALMAMNADSAGRKLLADFMLDGFRVIAPSLYDDMRRMAERVTESPLSTRLPYASAPAYRVIIERHRE